MKIQTKFFLILISLSLLMGVGVIVPGYLKIRTLVLNEAREYLKDRSLKMAQDIERSRLILERAGVSSIGSYVESSKKELISRYNTEQSDPHANSHIFDTDGKILLEKTSNSSIAITSKALSRIKEIKTGTAFLSDGTENWLLSINYDDQWKWLLMTSMPEKEVYSESSAYMVYVLTTSSAVLTLVIFFYLLLTSQFRRKLSLVFSHLKDYSDGEYNKRMFVKGTDEISVLQRNVNSMIDNIEKEINTRKDTEYALEEAKTEAEQANQAKSEFLANMSHEIRNPLHTIIGFTELLSSTNLTGHQASYVESISYAGNNLVTLLNDILEIEKIEQGLIKLNPDYFDIRGEIEAIFSLYATQAKDKGLDMYCNINDNVPQTLYADKMRCSQITSNLIHNAVKNTSMGFVELNIETEQETDDSYVINFIVKDTGIGIDKDKQDSVFSMFTQVDTPDPDQNSKGGFGLGLSIVNKIVNVMGGSIKLDSEINVGSTFSVTLPFVKKAPLQVDAEQITIESDTDLTHKKVLVVDDEELNLKYISEILRTNKVHYATASNGKEAIDLLQKEVFDIVLMDIRMPIMSGTQAIKTIRSELTGSAKYMPIVAMTANAFKDDVQEYMNIGATACIAKPFNAQQMLTTIQQLMAKHNIQHVVNNQHGVQQEANELD